MDIGTIKGSNAVLKAPQGWDADRAGECVDLPIKKHVVNDILPAMSSAWIPDAEERAPIAAGAPIILRVIAREHPPVMVEVGEVGDV